MAAFMSSLSSSSDSEFHNENAEDLSYGHLETIPDSALSRAMELVALQLNNNEIVQLPPTICLFTKLITLDISNNNMKKLCDEVCQLRNLRTFVAKNNRLNSGSLPKDFGLLQSLEVVNFSGNLFTDLAPQLTELKRLKCLYLGSNQLAELSSRVKHLLREFHNENAEDLSYGHLETIPDSALSRAMELVALQLNNNEIVQLPPTICLFTKLITLDISNNNMKKLCDEVCQLRNLRTFVAKNNRLNSGSLPKDFGLLQSLEVVNFSGNLFTDLAPQLTELKRLKCLYLGSNQLAELSSRVKHLLRLEVLYLGGNQLTEIPAEVGHLHNLVGLNLSDNRLQSLPPTLLSLRRLQALNLHNNCLQTLPPQIVALNLVELSLRKNPLVNRFVQDLVYNPPSLLELSGRVVKVEKMRYSREDLPLNLVRYLDSAQRCVNPHCKGVYFTSRVEHVKFVDFCGKYRLPLLQYLCSPSCTTAMPTVCRSDSDTEDEDYARERMRRVLLG